MLISSNWKPTASLERLRLRAQLYRHLREFFQQRNVLEVETPLLAHTTSTDPHLTSFSVAIGNKHLQTSPEFPMKRLLAAGSGAIYQICKAFRASELGTHHNPEFTMLEWYRPKFDHFDLMSEVAELVGQFLGSQPIRKLSYRDAFKSVLNEDPHYCTQQTLEKLATQHTGYITSDTDDRDILLDLLMSQVIGPHLGLNEFTFIYNYPASQCALARLTVDALGTQVAERFELYIDGLEIANGYHELTDCLEQQNRFEADLLKRSHHNLPAVPIDEHLISALSIGLPDCAGVALGVDRLLMLMANADSIREVIAFPIDIA